MSRNREKVARKKSIRTPKGTVEQRLHSAASSDSKLIAPCENPRYDKVYSDAMEWLDSLTTARNCMRICDEDFKK